MRVEYFTRDSVAELMMINFGESGHPIFRTTISLSRGTLKKQRRWKIMLSMYGAVSDVCE